MGRKVLLVFILACLFYLASYLVGRATSGHDFKNKDTAVTTLQKDASVQANKTFYDFKIEKLRDDGDIQFLDFKNKPVLVVNTASKCGYTPQYKGLEQLHQKYEKQGLVVLGIPSGDFGGQEFESDQETQKFCEVNYGVTFPLATKTKVSGDQAHAFYTWAEETSGNAPQWNFHKYLIDSTGQLVASYPSSVDPMDAKLTEKVETLLKK